MERETAKAEQLVLGDEGRQQPQVWAVGGGKGGVGKSVFCANLGVAMARLGQRTVLIDADLGGANLHTLLGIDNAPRTLADFLSRRVPNLQDVFVPTATPKLQLVSGSNALLEMANPRHVQKLKLLRHIRKLPVDQVLLDLGAGSTFNVLDFFLAADQRIVVVAPEPTSIENAYHFLKSAFYRNLRQAAKSGDRQTLIGSILQDRMRRGIRSPRELVKAVREEAPEISESLSRTIENFRAFIVVNQARRAEHQRLGAEMELACRDYFGAPMTHLATLQREDDVLDAIFERRPVIERTPNSAFSREIRHVAKQLIEGTA